jgi:hypothetical protein
MLKRSESLVISAFTFFYEEMKSISNVNHHRITLKYARTLPLIPFPLIDHNYRTGV